MKNKKPDHGWTSMDADGSRMRHARLSGFTRLLPRSAGALAVAALYLGACTGAGAQTNADIAVSFFSKAAFELEQGAACFLRFRAADRRVPLFAAGTARRGDVRIFLSPLDEGFTAKMEASGIVDMDPPVGSADAEAVEETAAAGLLKNGVPLRLILRDLRLDDVMLTDAAWKAMIGAARSGVGPREPLSAGAKVTAKMEVKAPTASTTVTLPMRMTIQYRGQRRFGRLVPYWRLILSGDFALEGSALGLTGRDAGRLDVRVGIAADTWLPRDYAGKQADKELEESAETNVTKAD
jgi:hypothetical protein